MKQKSLGQIAFEELIRGRAWYNDESFSDLSKFEQEEWNDIATAVARELRRRDRKKKHEEGTFEVFR